MSRGKTEGRESGSEWGWAWVRGVGRGGTEEI